MDNKDFVSLVLRQYECSFMHSFDEFYSESFINSLVVAGLTIAESSGKVVVTGLGKSGIIGQKIAATLRSHGIFSVFIHPVEALHGDIGLVGSDDVVIALSNSGSTIETVRFVRQLALAGNTIIAITGNASSDLAFLSKILLVYSCESEVSPLGLAPMCSTTLSLVIGDVLIHFIACVSRFTSDDFSRLHPAGSLGLESTLVRNLMILIDGVPCLAPTHTLHQAISFLHMGKLGIVFVVNDEGSLIGVLTDGDIRKDVACEPWQLDFLRPVSSIMSRDPKTISPSDSLKEALSRMKSHSITALAVVDEQNRPVGLIRMNHIMEWQLRS